MILSTWFLFSGGKQLYRYLRLTESAPIVVDKWVIEEKGGDRYAVYAVFSFVFNQQAFKGKVQAGGVYPNPWAAELAEKRLNQKKWTVWFDPKHPDRATLEKKFPLKAVVSSSVVILCGLYVLSLMWVGVKNGNGGIFRGSA